MKLRVEKISFRRFVGQYALIAVPYVLVHWLLELPYPLCTAVNEWLCVGFKPPRWFFDYFLPAVVSAYLTAHRGRIETPVIGWYRVFVWPIMLLSLDFVHLDFDHGGMMDAPGYPITIPFVYVLWQLLLITLIYWAFAGAFAEYSNMSKSEG